TPKPLASRSADVAAGGAPHGSNPRASHPISPIASICIAGLTAAVVIGVGVFIAERGEPPRPPAPYASAPRPALVPTVASAHAAISANPSTAGPSSRPTSPAPAPAEPTPAPAFSGSPPASASPPALAPPESLAPYLGYLTVRGQGDARVYVNGVDMGPLNHTL